ncbi:MAG: hypothetical protein HY731_06200, partial [Candidatus Tectomicrobia bacterium]|nr:hypothetical protein [Candidatus Tectomicrobia bacterium]
GGGGGGGTTTTTTSPSAVTVSNPSGTAEVSGSFSSSQGKLVSNSFFEPDFAINLGIANLEVRNILGQAIDPTLLSSNRSSSAFTFTANVAAGNDYIFIATDRLTRSDDLRHFVSVLQAGFVDFGTLGSRATAAVSILERWIENRLSLPTSLSLGNSLLPTSLLNLLISNASDSTRRKVVSGGIYAAVVARLLQTRIQTSDFVNDPRPLFSLLSRFNDDVVNTLNNLDETSFEVILRHLDPALFFDTGGTLITSSNLSGFSSIPIRTIDPALIARIAGLNSLLTIQSFSPSEGAVLNTLRPIAELVFALPLDQTSTLDGITVLVRNQVTGTTLSAPLRSAQDIVDVRFQDNDSRIVARVKDREDLRLVNGGRYLVNVTISGSVRSKNNRSFTPGISTQAAFSIQISP